MIKKEEIIWAEFGYDFRAMAEEIDNLRNEVEEKQREIDEHVCDCEHS